MSLILRKICSFGASIELELHTHMRYLGFGEDVADRVKTEVLIERDRLCLRMETKRVRALSAGIVGYHRHEVFAEAFVALDGQHAADAEHPFLRVRKETGICDDEALFAEGEVHGDEVDVILVEIVDMLLADKDPEPCFEDFIEVGGCQLREE